MQRIEANQRPRKGAWPSFPIFTPLPIFWILLVQRCLHGNAVSSVTAVAARKFQPVALATQGRILLDQCLFLVARGRQLCTQLSTFEGRLA